MFLCMEQVFNFKGLTLIAPGIFRPNVIVGEARAARMTQVAIYKDKTITLVGINIPNGVKQTLYKG